MKHEILLEVGDFLPRIPKQLLHDGAHDTESKLRFDVAELADRIGRGETTIRLTEIHRRAPEIFCQEILASDKTAVRFPWQKVAHLLAAARAMPSHGSRAEGLTHAGAEFLAERLRSYRAALKITPARTETSGIPHPVPAPPPVLTVGWNTWGGPPTAKPPASWRRPAPAVHGKRKVLPEGALTLSVNTTGTARKPPPYDDEKLSREELLRSREALRAQLARIKSEFARQLAAAWQERQKTGVERERFVAEMMRANTVASERGEQIAFEKRVAAKIAENLTQSQEDAWVLQRELSALQAEMVKAHEETDLFIEELIAERNTLAQGQPLASHQVAGLQKRRLLGLTIKEAARVAAVPRPSRETPGRIDASKSPIATSDGRDRDGAAHIEETQAGRRREFAPAVRSILATLALPAVLAGILATWYLQLSQHDGALSAELRQLDREWAAVSASLDQARMARSQLQMSINGARSARDEFDGDDRWTPALRSIVASANAGIELREIQVLKKNPDDPRAGGLRIEGVATGTAPRATADQFLQTLQREMRQHFQVAEPCRFELLEDEPELPSAEPDQRRAIFTITAPIGAAVPHNVETHPKTEA